MRSPWRWLRRRRELKCHASRRSALEMELKSYFGRAVELQSASTKGGYDEIYNASSSGQRFGVVRVNSPFKTQNDPIGKFDPGVPLGPKGRLEREWTSYAALHPLGISPQPLWRAEDAIACSWMPWERVANVLKRNPARVWDVLAQVVPAVSLMHSQRITHLDLNLGNLLLEPTGEGVAIIDFEFGPADWVSPGQQMAFDYLRLVDDCIKPRRGGNHLLENPTRLVNLLDESVAPDARTGDVQFAFTKLRKLAQHPSLLRELDSIFG